MFYALSLSSILRAWYGSIRATGHPTRSWRYDELPPEKCGVHDTSRPRRPPHPPLDWWHCPSRPSGHGDPPHPVLCAIPGPWQCMRQLRIHAREQPLCPNPGSPRPCTITLLLVIHKCKSFSFQNTTPSAFSLLIVKVFNRVNLSSGGKRSDDISTTAISSILVPHVKIAFLILKFSSTHLLLMPY